MVRARCRRKKAPAQPAGDVKVGSVTTGLLLTTAVRALAGYYIHTLLTITVKGRNGKGFIFSTRLICIKRNKINYYWRLNLRSGHLAVGDRPAKQVYFMVPPHSL
jgi:hypothetical protein